MSKKALLTFLAIVWMAVLSGCMTIMPASDKDKTINMSTLSLELDFFNRCFDRAVDHAIETRNLSIVYDNVKNCLSDEGLTFEDILSDYLYKHGVKIEIQQRNKGESDAVDLA